MLDINRINKNLIAYLNNSIEPIELQNCLLTYGKSLIKEFNIPLYRGIHLNPSDKVKHNPNQFYSFSYYHEIAEFFAVNHKETINDLAFIIKINKSKGISVTNLVQFLRWSYPKLNWDIPRWSESEEEYFVQYDEYELEEIKYKSMFQMNIF